MIGFAYLMGIGCFSVSIVLSVRDDPAWATMQAVALLWYILAELKVANERAGKGKGDV